MEGNHKTYYHMKDIAFLAHDPLIEKFRYLSFLAKGLPSVFFFGGYRSIQYSLTEHLNCMPFWLIAHFSVQLRAYNVSLSQNLAADIFNF